MQQSLSDIIVTVQCRVCHGGYEARINSIPAEEKICTPCWEYQYVEPQIYNPGRQGQLAFDSVS